MPNCNNNSYSHADVVVEMINKDMHLQKKKLYRGWCETAPPFFIKRKPNQLNRVEKPPNPGPCPWGSNLAASTARVFFLSAAWNSLMMRFELRTCWEHDATGPGLANQPPDLSRYASSQYTLYYPRISTSECFIPLSSQHSLASWRNLTTIWNMKVTTIGIMSLRIS